MFYRYKTALRKADFYRKTAGILSTAPMPIVDAPWRVVSMVSNSDVQMYLIALKSFYSRMGAGRVTAIIDRDMPAKCKSTLEHHFPGIEFAILEEIDTGPCQRGGTWERILYLIDRSQDEYAIQLDADTLTFGDIAEVKQFVENNVAFTVNGQTGRHKGLLEPDMIRPMVDFVELARQSDSNYVGLAAERKYGDFSGHENYRYIRGSSGFVGLSKGGVTRELIEHFHREGEKLVGERWREWGTEQSASNFAVANSPNSVVLPYPKYGNFDPQAMHPETSFLHFIGARRYKENLFAKLTNQVIQSLNNSAHRALAV